jgi:CO/xanthine dehydrogenase Mo-binding subunit
MNAPSTRRHFLRSAGFLSLSFAIPLELARSQQGVRLPGNLNTNRQLSAWLRIESDHTVTLMVGKVELGQGVLTAVSQVCADELDVDFERIRVISGDTQLVPDEGITAGSLSMPYCAPAVRQASAEVRAILLELAAKQWGRSSAELTVRSGVIRAPNGDSLRYGDLLIGQALHREATGTVPLKPLSEHRYIGRSVQRPDIFHKVMGHAIFVQELRPEGLWHGQLVRPPSQGARLIQADLAKVQGMPGVVKVVRHGSFLGVVAQRLEQAHAAAQALAQSAQWTPGPALPAQADFEAWLRRAPSRPIQTHQQARASGPAAQRSVKASYYRPHQMHASIGPSAAIAHFDGRQIVVQTHSQSVFETRQSIAKLLGLTLENVRLQHVQGSGCYGHNLADDAAADAALLAHAVPGHPIKLQYTREQEHQWEPYGSAMAIDIEAGLNEQGDVLDWNLQIWSMPHNTRPQGDPGNMLSAKYLDQPFAQPLPGNLGAPNFAADRNGVALYDFPGQEVLTHFVTEMPLRVSSHRGLGAYANVFAIESFMDELARHAKADPLAFRLRHLKDPRARDALTEVARVFGWDRWQARPGHGRGIGFARYKNIATYCAVALEVQVNPATGHVRVLRAVASADSGHIVNPDGVRNQIEGGLIQSLSWTLKEQVHFDAQQVQSTDWASYPILSFSEVPDVEVVLIDRPNAPFLGAGEASQGPTGAAVANAVFDAIGVRMRQLPLTPDRVLKALGKA